MARRKITKTIFFKPKDVRLARKISIRSPSEFRASIRELEKKGITTKEKRALTLARTRASLQLKRKTLSEKERKEFKMIVGMKLPKVSVPKKLKKKRRLR